MFTLLPRGSPLRPATGEVVVPGCLDFMFMFDYQIFDFIQLMRGEPVIARERNGAEPELRLVAGAGHMDVGWLIVFIAIEQEMITASWNLDGGHKTKMAVA